MIEWADGIPEVLFPYGWTKHPTRPNNIRRGIVSIDWLHHPDIPGCVGPEGWCCLIRREAWREMEPQFPMAFGILKMLASAVRDGHPCGVLCQYGSYIKHYGQGSTPRGHKVDAKPPDVKTWWEGLECESLDFTLGPHETSSFMSWSRCILNEYRNTCEQESDIKEHLPTLYDLARECSHIVEGGVRYVVSSWAWIWGCACNGGEVHSYCWTETPEITLAKEICEKEGVPWHFYDGDWLQREIPETDLLFIDTNHEAWQLREELRLHAPKARRYIVLHDTETFGDVGADDKRPGLMGPINDLVAEGTWRIKTHYPTCNGLTVLERT
ncbi:MAG: class I SAM-dependent methyltransferase [Planctomycetota bacterium]|jgi:hypothetical protein